MSMKTSLERKYYRFGTTQDQQDRIEKIMLHRYNVIPAAKSKMYAHSLDVKFFVNATEDAKKYQRLQMHTLQIDVRDVDMAVRLEHGWYGDIDQIENKDAKLTRRGICYVAEVNGKRRVAARAVTALLKCYGIY